MGLLWILGAAALLLGVSSGSSPSPFSHSLHYRFMVVSEPGVGLPQFIVTAHLDGRLFAYYDSEGKKGQPRELWMEEMIQVDTQYWDWLNRNARNTEHILKWQIRTVMGRYNHSRGFHTLQWLFGCELSQDEHKAGFNKFSYDGKEALSFEKDSLTWTAYDPVGQEYKREWESEPGRTQRSKHYLEEKCIGMLRQLLKFDKKKLQRRVAPEVKVVHKKGRDSVETLVCHIHGFYPKTIDATWRKNGEVLETETHRGNVVPNSDGTFHTWLSIEIDPEERDQYHCTVEHDSLLGDPDPAVEQPVPGISLWVMAGVILGLVLLVVPLIIIIIMTIRHRRERRPPALREEMRSINPPRKRRHVLIQQEH
uniref:Major histocompatibility complex class I-related gene protein-like n=1 Tax=Pogona vitticeps TaxID=103695 RepID=A0ABM5FF01_9SAUR